jgi:hypothetical protein
MENLELKVLSVQGSNVLDLQRALLQARLAKSLAQQAVQ